MLHERYRFARFTPTGVGTMSIFNPFVGVLAVHPHGRGDNLGLATKDGSSVGSPPRAWGQSRQVERAGGRRRFTPTGVGTIRARVPSRIYSAVHPHGRGDNRATLSLSLVRNGSPPRAWGQSMCVTTSITGRRFTPTGVGTMSGVALEIIVLAVHPHGRGDNPSMPRATIASVGSPPRAWGQSVR